jgi:hypothetical protein
MQQSWRVADEIVMDSPLEAWGWSLAGELK